jgi:hypothetical protein
MMVGDQNTPLSKDQQRNFKASAHIKPNGHNRQQPIQYTIFSTANGIISKIHCILGHKASLNKFKKIKIALCII